MAPVEPETGLVSVVAAPQQLPSARGYGERTARAVHRRPGLGRPRTGGGSGVPRLTAVHIRGPVHSLVRRSVMSGSACHARHDGWTSSGGDGFGIAVEGTAAGGRGPRRPGAAGRVRRLRERRRRGWDAAVPRPAVPSWPARPARPGRHPCPAGLPPPWAIADYDGGARGAILAHKEDGRFGLVAPLGDALARSVLAGLAATAGARPDCRRRPGAGALPPYGRARPRSGRDAATHPPRRGRRFAGPARTSRCCPSCASSAGMADQAGLDARGRAANLQGALAVPHRLARHRAWSRGGRRRRRDHDRGEHRRDGTGAARRRRGRPLRRRGRGNQATSTSRPMPLTRMRLASRYGTRPGPWLRPSQAPSRSADRASRCQPQAKRPT